MDYPPSFSLGISQLDAKDKDPVEFVLGTFDYEDPNFAENHSKHQNDPVTMKKLKEVPSKKKKSGSKATSKKKFDDSDRPRLLNVQGEIPKFTMLEFVIITGLKCTSDIDDYMYTSSSKSALMSKYFSNAKQGITRSKLITHVNMRNFDNSEDALNLAILFFVHTFMFSQHKKAPISLAHFQIVEDRRSADEVQPCVGTMAKEFSNFSTILPQKFLIKVGLAFPVSPEQPSKRKKTVIFQEDSPVVMDDDKSTRARPVCHVSGLYSETQKDAIDKREFGMSGFEHRHQGEIGVSPESDQLKFVPSSSTEPEGTSKLSLDSDEIKNYINK
ncbi:hypothetical protein FXO38_06573 [Capsicum annuum]|nr:hypothetical protein FXO38_06573 [Capsicum annuum]